MSSELVVQIIKGFIGVEIPPARSFWCGVWSDSLICYIWLMHLCAVTRPHFSNLDHEDTDSDESEEDDDEPVRTL